MKNIWKIVGTTLLVVLFIALFTGIALESFKDNENAVRVSRNLNEQGKLNQPEIPGYQLIVSNPDKGVAVYGKKLDSQPYFEQVLVKTDSAQRVFNWKASTKNPRLMFANITGSGEEYEVIIFVTAYGTGILDSEIHVLDKSLTKEIPVEKPEVAARRLIRSRGEGQEIVFTAGRQEYRVKPSIGPAGIAQELKNLQYGSVVNYNVVNNKIYATVSVQTNPSVILGEFTLLYTFTGGKLVPQVTNFKKLN
jgi:hypothetical protein